MKKGPRDAGNADAAEKPCNNLNIPSSNPEHKATTGTSSAQENKPSGPRPVTICLADVAPKSLQWLWPNRIPLGKLTLIFGDPGLGKSFVTLDIAARVSTGKHWPDLPDVPNVAGGVVLLSAEDDLSDTIRPRLDAAGADLSRITAFQGVRHSGRTTVTHLSLGQHIPQLEQAVIAMQGARLIVIDPISAYLGCTDDHRNAELRGLLAPVAELACKHDVAVVCVTHMNKAEARKVMYRAMGSLAYVAAARAAWLAAEDRDHKNRRLLLPVKMNLAPGATALAYRIVDGAVEWEAEPFTMTADDVLGGEAQFNASKLEEAVEFIRGTLADGPLSSKELVRLAEAAGISERTLERARSKLGAAINKTRNQPHGDWMVSLPRQPSSQQPDNQSPKEDDGVGDVGGVSQDRQDRQRHQAVL